MIVITGAAGSLGAYLCERLSPDFAIAGTYNVQRPAYYAETLQYHQVDVRDAKSIQGFVTTLATQLREITLLNLAGISIDGMAHKLAEEAWDQVLDTNLKGTWLMCRALLPLMRAQKWGRIINVSSVVGQRGIVGTAAYAASKAGLEGLTRALAVENATKGITVNALALGYFAAGMIDTLTAPQQAQIKASIPLQCFGDPRNIELAVRFLMAADYVTGAVIDINGGL